MYYILNEEHKNNWKKAIEKVFLKSQELRIIPIDRFIVASLYLLTGVFGYMSIEPYLQDGWINFEQIDNWLQHSSYPGEYVVFKIAVNLTTTEWDVCYTPLDILNAVDNKQLLLIINAMQMCQEINSINEIKFLWDR